MREFTICRVPKEVFSLTALTIFFVNGNNPEASLEPCQTSVKKLIVKMVNTILLKIFSFAKSFILDVWQGHAPL